MDAHAVDGHPGMRIELVRLVVQWPSVKPKVGAVEKQDVDRFAGNNSNRILVIEMIIGGKTAQRV